jgi:acetyl esterase/lipase
VTARRALFGLLAAAAACAATGCEVGKRVVITPFYRALDLPDARIVRDLAYVDGPGAHPVKHRLDLFLPEKREGRGFTTVVFVHGGNWVEGDKSLHVAGADLYANIGRFLASHGYGAAVVNYRLMPEVAWEAQPADVASAVKWIRGHIASYGGDPDGIVLMGHSAGAQLAALVAVSPRWLREAGVPARAIRGVIAVSGAGFDIADEETYRLFGGTQASVAKRFRIPVSPGWAPDASPVNHLDKGDPPFLLMYPTGDKRGVLRQSALMQAALAKAGVWTWVAPIPGLNHTGVIIVMSRPDRAPGLVVLRYLDQLSLHSR